MFKLVALLKSRGSAVFFQGKTKNVQGEGVAKAYLSHLCLKFLASQGGGAGGGAGGGKSPRPLFYRVFHRFRQAKSA
jgi:hypothetical protein